MFRLVRFILLFAGFLSSYLIHGQNKPSQIPAVVYPAMERLRDSLEAIKIPLLTLPDGGIKTALPDVVDNSQNLYWPGIRDQYNFYSCQQHCGVGYVFGYEINRARNQPGWHWENSYPPHYTWNFMNQGEQYVGVNFLQSFDILRSQGQMTSSVYGNDTAYSFTGWVNGYDQYFSGMSNRLKKVNAIQVNSEEGILLLKHFLFDHLDGSPTGGIACFTTSSATLVNMEQLPAGTPEAGKNIIQAWYNAPTHGLTIVGYNDSIRFDRNNDGQYTNHLDITGDGVKDARDWEIGGFKIANSYGYWWSNDGFAYALYSSFAYDYPWSGIWNNRVYVVTPDTGYHPLLTAKIKIAHNLRNQLKISAGVSQDTTNQFPMEIIELPIFNFQGGPNPMHGDNQISVEEPIEAGLDLTPLLNKVNGDQPARFFLLIEERDPEHRGSGMVHSADFLLYGSQTFSYRGQPDNTEIKDNGTTVVSAVITPVKPQVRITTEELPPVISGQPYEIQLAAAGGTSPYSWRLSEGYEKREIVTEMPAISGQSLYLNIAHQDFYAIPLPFQFSFYGKRYDTIYVNHYGFICFEPQFLPGPYITMEQTMLTSFPIIAPAFSLQYSYNPSSGDGIWQNHEQERMVIKWRVTANQEEGKHLEFAAVLFPDGSFNFRYGGVTFETGLPKLFSGVSKGDKTNHRIELVWNPRELDQKCFHFTPRNFPTGIQLTESGLLTMENPEPGNIFDLDVVVADAGRIEATKRYTLAGELLFSATIDSEEPEQVIPGKLTRVNLKIVNRGAGATGPLTFTLSGNDPNVSLEDSTEILTGLGPGESAMINGAFAFFPSAEISNDYPVTFSLTGTGAGISSQRTVIFHAAAAVIRIADWFIDDGDNGLIDPGEVADFRISLRNEGVQSSSELTLELASVRGLISLLSEPDIEVGKLSPATEKVCSFRLQASKEAISGSADTVIIRLTDTSGLIRQEKIGLTLGKRAVAVVSLASASQSGSVMAAVFDSLRVGYDMIGTIPFDYSKYESVFLLLGAAASGGHTLTVDEAGYLTGYLESGGNLYMESYNSWYYLNKTPLHPYFKYTSAKVPSWGYPEAEGISQTFADSMIFDYNGPITYAIFSFDPVSPAYATFKGTNANSRNLQIVYNGEDYKTIGTMLEFASLEGTTEPSTRYRLMERYLDFFGVNASGPFPLFHAEKNPVCAGSLVRFNDDSFDNIVSRNWEFPGGTPSSSTEANPEVIYHQPGKYDVSLTVSDGSKTVTKTKTGYIKVETCTGIDQKTNRAGLLIYPNPARTSVTVVTNVTNITNVTTVTTITTPTTLTLHDLTGQIVLEKIIDNEQDKARVTLDLHGVHPGAYILRLMAPEGIVTGKLIIQ